MSTRVRFHASFVLLTLFAVFAFLPCRNAGGEGREGRGELFVQGLYLWSNDTSDDLLSLKFDDVKAGGAGFGINLNDQLNLNVFGFYGSPGVTLAAPLVETTEDVDMYGGSINLDIYFFNARLTPFITGGVGLVKFDGTVGAYEFNETDFSYNAGGGFRWDISDHLLLKAYYTSTWIQLEDFDDIRFDGGNLTIGVIF